mgnify:CR=1 FL=1
MKGRKRFILTDSLPYWPINPTLTNSFATVFQVDLVKSLWMVLPGAILWGASFPLALAAVSVEGQDPGKVVGTVRSRLHRARMELREQLKGVLVTELQIPLDRLVL